MDCLAHAAPAAAESGWTLFDLVGSGVAVTSADGTVEYCNGALLRLLAKDAVALCGTSIFALLDGGADGALEELHRAALGTDREMRTQVRSPGRFVAGAVLRRSGEGQRVIWSFVDARFNEPVPELALWGTEIGLWDWDVVNDRLTWINDWCEHSQLTAFSGYGHEQLWCSRIHPEDLSVYREAITRHLDGQTPPYDVEYRLRNRGGAWVWIQERGRVIERDATGRAWRAVGLCLDVDERHKSARALEHSEARLAHAIWGSSVGLWDHDVANDWLHWWNDWCVNIDLDPCHGANHSVRWDALVHPDDLPRFSGGYERLIAGTSDSYEAEYRIRTRSGQWRWILSRGRATARDNAGRAVRLAGATIDIDARKRMELAQRDSEARLRTQAVILETMREGVVLLNPVGRMEFTNPAFDRMFGPSTGEPAGISAAELLGLHGRGGTRDMLFRRRDGGQFAAEVLSEEIDLSGEKRILIVVQDVSERKQLESEIIEIANRERRRLGADLHDGLGQELTGISLMLRSLSKRAVPVALEASPELNEIIALVNHAIQSSRRMALGISPVTLERGGLLPALQTLVAWSCDSYGVDVRLHLGMRSQLLIGESAAAHLYLIVQEAINNAVRHGNARSIAVRLRANRVVLSLSITDDGVGLAETGALGAGMGLKLMRYRCAMIGGVMRVKRMPRGGTRIHSVCPQDFAAAGFPKDHDAQR
ncbi:MAG TPA: PAS domain-containing protein [Steroidobacteraceae bacterium]|nr:PAS domain-containing protein [Steroidobacteraceae bacterium]